MADSEQALLTELEARSSIGFDELKERLDDVKTLIALGAARLAVFQTPWGIEFSLELS
jgi:hypothetical protein